jgi:hypothetical protein
MKEDPSVPVTLDFWHLTNGTYFKLVASKPIDIDFWTQTMVGITEMEFKWTVPSMIVTNTSTEETCTIDFLVAK